MLCVIVFRPPVFVLITGESVPNEEQTSVKDAGADSLTSSNSMTALPQLTASGGAMSEEEVLRWQLEKQGLCQQLDEKVG